MNIIKNFSFFIFRVKRWVYYAQKSISLILIALPITLFSLPKEDRVVHGCISFEKSEKQIQITQKCPKAIIDWKDFSLDEGEIAKFKQGDNFSVLNRVVTDKISKIYGSIEANGKFYLINQNGILIGPKGSISAKEVLLSTLELSKENYLKDKDLKFNSLKDGKIENFGSIKAVSSDIYILSKTIENHKNISAKYGSVNLIAASEVLIIAGKKDIIIKPEIDGSITNEGNIKAIKIKLKSSNDNLDSFAINQKGLLQARGFEKKNGKVILVSEKGITKHSGTITAKNKNETAGKVKVLGQHVVLDNSSKIDASASFGGGEVLIGGDYQGKNPKIQNAKRIFIDKDAKIVADSLENGNGGKVILWADEANWFLGNISAKGGKVKGDGGFVEVSSKNKLDFKGIVSTKAFNGKTGKLLLDPSDITISSAASNPVPTPSATNFTLYDPNNVPAGEIATNLLNASDLVTSLNQPNNITVTTTSGVLGSGDIAVNNDVVWTSAGDLSLLADNSLTLANGVSIGGASTSGDIIFEMNSLTFSGTNSVQSSGEVTFRTKTKSTKMGIGTGTGALAINAGVISSLVDGFSKITIGDSAQTGSTNIGTATFTDSVDVFAFFATFSGIQTVTGTANVIRSGGGGFLIGSNVDTNWTITADNAGTMSPTGSSTFNFLDFVQIFGGSANDTFTFNGAFRITLGLGTAGGDNTVIGPNLVTNWTVTADDTGSISPTGASGSTTLDNIQNFIGGSNNDTFLLSGGRLSGTTGLDGGSGGTNELHADSSANIWTIDGLNSGYVTVSTLTNFQRMQVLTGTNADDTFNVDFTSGQTLTLNGKAGDNSVRGPNASNVWTIGNSLSTTGDNRGTLVIAGSGLISFVDIQSITGGTNADNFIFGGAQKLTGTTGIDGNGGTNILTGASGETNFFDLSLSATDNEGDMTINGSVTTAFIDIQKVVGAGVATNNTLQGRNTSNTFLIDNIDNGDLNSSTLIFENVGNLTGNSQNDFFKFSNGSLTGNLDGGGGISEIDTTLSTGSLLISMPGGVGIVSGSTGISNIDTIRGGVANETLIGRDEIAIWNITSSNGGTFSNITDGAVSFIAIDSLTGGNLRDAFNLSGSGSINALGQINGGGGDNFLTAVIVGSANTWNITDNDAGDVTPVSVAATNFSNIQNLEGNPLTKDTFILSDGKGLTGKVDGGACGLNNTIDYSAYTTAVSVSVPCPPVSGDGSATNIFGDLPGGLLNIDTFIAPPSPPPPPPPRSTALDAAYKSELFVIYDLKDFVEFNKFMKRYKLIYIKNSFINMEDNKKILKPELKDEVFKDLKKD